MAGNYKQRKTSWEDVTFEDFSVPANFYFIYFLPTAELYQWFAKSKLLLGQYQCDICNEPCGVNTRRQAPFECTFRCKKTKNHERHVTRYSFLDKVKISPRDVLVFIRCYLLKLPLKLCASEAGINYGNTAVEWADFIRRVMVEDVISHIDNIQFHGSVEIGESRFGTKLKNTGILDAEKGVWVFWLTERESNRLIVIPVKDRSKETLLPIILKHIDPGARVYSEGKVADLDLNTFGYNHFTLVHKTPFSQTYVNTSTEEKDTVHSNSYESAWARAKQHFIKIHGSKGNTFESHVCEVMWRNWHIQENIHRAFYDSLRKIYTLQGPPNFRVKYPIFLGVTELTDLQPAPVQAEVIPQVDIYENFAGPLPPLATEATDVNSTANTSLNSDRSSDLSLLDLEIRAATAQLRPSLPSGSSPPPMSAAGRRRKRDRERKRKERSLKSLIAESLTSTSDVTPTPSDPVPPPEPVQQVQSKKCKIRTENGTTFTTLDVPNPNWT